MPSGRKGEIAPLVSVRDTVKSPFFPLPEPAFLNIPLKFVLLYQVTLLNRHALRDWGVGGFVLVPEIGAPAKLHTEVWSAEALKTYCPKSSLFKEYLKASQVTP